MSDNWHGETDRSLLQSESDNFVESTLNTGKLSLWKYVQLCLYLFTFAKYRHEKTEIGIKDYIGCNKLQNSLI